MPELDLLATSWQGAALVMLSLLAPSHEGVKTTRSVHILLSSTGFPMGMAATERVRHIANSLGQENNDVTVLCIHPSEWPGSVQNTETRGVLGSVRWQYTSGRTVYPRTFVGRRLSKLLGLLGAVGALGAARARGELDCVIPYAITSRLSLRILALTAFARCLGAAIVVDVVERPWSIRQTRRLLERRVSPLRIADGVVVISDFLESWAVSELARLKKEVRVVRVPILVDVEEWSISAAGIVETPFVLLAASSSYRETIAFSIGVMNEVWRTHPDCRLKITGVHPTRRTSAWLRNGQRDGSLDGRVDLLWLSSRQEISELTRRAAVLLSPLLDDESSVARFPTKLAEYLSSGRPVVATEVGEQATFLEHGVSALLSEPGDVSAHAQAVVALLEDAELAKSVGQKGRDLAESAFDWRVHSRTLSNSVLGAMQRRSQRRGSHSVDALKQAFGRLGAH